MVRSHRETERPERPWIERWVSRAFPLSYVVFVDSSGRVGMYGKYPYDRAVAQDGHKKSVIIDRDSSDRSVGDVRLHLPFRL